MCGSTVRSSEPLAFALLEEMLKGLYSVAIVATRATFRLPKVVKKTIKGQLKSTDCEAYPSCL